MPPPLKLLTAGYGCRAIGRRPARRPSSSPHSTHWALSKTRVGHDKAPVAFWFTPGQRFGACRVVCGIKGSTAKKRRFYGNSILSLLTLN
jgi:hypothetical protein